MDRSWMYTKRRHNVSCIQDVNVFIEAAKRHALIKQTMDIYCPCCDGWSRIVCQDPNRIRSHLVRRGFKENYEIWDHHGETYGCRQQGSTRRGLIQAEAQLMLMNSL
jgi:hypothetical protein